MTAEVTPKTVDNLEVLLPHLSEKQEAEFRLLVSRYKRSWDHLSQLQNLINEQTKILGVDLDTSLTDYQQIKNEITQTETWISSEPKLDWSVNRLPIIISRIRVRLSDPKVNLPFPIRWIKKFALPQHPQLAPLIQERSAIENKLDNKKQEYSQNLAKLQQNKKEDLDLASTNLQRSGTFILTFCDELSTASIELAEKYISVVPDRAEKVARDYVEKNIASDHILNHFPSFINHIHTLLIDEKDKGAAKRRYGHWLNEAEIPTHQQLLGLTPSAQRRFTEFVVYTIITDWAKQGFIDQQQLPDILRVP